jgi:putative colanic acid biosynthesis UDP-glucose lipid carrier transferase
VLHQTKQPNTNSMTEKYGTYYRLISVLVDLALLNLSGYFAYLLSLWLNNIGDALHISVVHILLINFLWFNVTQITRLYHDIFSKDAIPTVKQSLLSLLIFAVLLFSLAYILPEFTVTDTLLRYLIVSFSLLFLTGKICFLLLRRSHRARLIEYTRVVIVGAGPVGVELAKIMESKLSMGYRIVGFFDDKPNLQAGNVYILGKVEECIDYVKSHGIKEIYCALPDRAIDKINLLMRSADREMIRFKLVPDVKDYFKKNVNVKMLGHFPVISPRTEPLENMTNKVLKRCFDICFSLFILICLMSWLIPILAIWIKLDSKGPVFFKQLRSGKNNTPFWCWKLRSMRVNADSDLLQASAQDSRITRIGAILRKTSLDELPQFFNVLLGDMSVVGPRPHMVQHTTDYSGLIDEFMVRHLVLPGITGWAQVTGFRGGTATEGSMKARVAADIWYLENWSVMLDLKIFFLTIWQVLSGDENAY